LCFCADFKQHKWQRVFTLRRPALEAADVGLLPPSLLLPAPDSDLLKLDRLSHRLAAEPACAAAFELFARPGRPAVVAASPAVLGLLQYWIVEFNDDR
jgi:hypothetical protein